jgi:YegS/Rv2252/BmrU family lipid kinase
VTDVFTIINPAAGGGRCGRTVDHSLERLRAGGLVLDVHRTRAPGHATDLAREGTRQGFERFVSIGGDGTTFEVVNGLLPIEEHAGPPTLGMIPLGTGNSFLRDFDILGTTAAIHAVIQGDVRRCDVIRAEHETGTIHYINLLSVAFSARAGALTNEKFKRFGAAGYILAVLTCIVGLDHPEYAYTLDAGELRRHRVALLSFSNSKFTGGTMMMAPRADVTDGLMDVITVGELSRLRMVATFPKIFQGTHVHERDISQTRARTVTFVEPREENVMVDGEVLRLTLRTLEVLPGALRVNV